MSRCVVTNGDTLNFYLDFRPRAYGAYDLRDADGNYPGPDTLGRKSFEYSGARKDFDTKFGTEDVVAFFGDIMDKFEGAVENPGLGDASLSEVEQLTRGPMAMDVTMPLRYVCLCLLVALYVGPLYYFTFVDTQTLD